MSDNYQFRYRCDSADKYGGERGVGEYSKRNIGTRQR